MRHLTLSLFLLVCALQVVQAKERPNILLIYVDDLGYGDLASYGHPVIETPNLDELANSGMQLTSYYAPSALCSPSRAGILTGRHPYRTGIESWIPEGSGVFLHDDEVTLAEVLNDVGYQTALIGKWHLNSDLASSTEPQPTDQGFDYFYGHNAFQIPTNKNPTNIYRNKQALGMQKGYTADLYADEAIEWLNKAQTDEPFFLMLSMAEPHTTIENPPEFNEMYRDFTNGEIIPIPNGLAAPPVEKLIARGPGEYYANISYMDSQIGRVLDWLNENNASESTVIVFASDNGPVTSDWLTWYEVNAYGSTGGFRGRKRLLHEGGIRVPAIVSWPGQIASGTQSAETIVGTDFFVTLAKLGGASVPSDRAIDGIDVLPALRGEKLAHRRLFWALDSVSDLTYAVRDGDWKMLLNRNLEAKELFNLAIDPLEMLNIVDRETEVADKLRRFAFSSVASIQSDPLRPVSESTD